MSENNRHKGGEARAAKLTPEERSEIAKNAAGKRWGTKEERDSLLKATHQGVLHIMDKELSCAVLSDGTRIISKSAIFKAFERTKRGRKKDDIRVPNMPAFIDANNLQPFIDNDLMGVLNTVQYVSSQGRIAEGYKAEILPLMCDVYLAARASNSLTKSQGNLAVVSEIMVRSLSKVGISALIDEATGYQAERDRDSLQKLLAAYLSEEKLKWAKMFPDEFYKQVFRLRGWTYHPMSRPQLLGKITNHIVYEKLPPQVLEELRKRNPIVRKNQRAARHHQFLTEDIGQKDLREHLLQLIAVMRLSDTWEVFLMHLEKAFPDKKWEEMDKLLENE